MVEPALGNVSTKLNASWEWMTTSSAGRAGGEKSKAWVRRDQMPADAAHAGQKTHAASRPCMEGEDAW